MSIHGLHDLSERGIGLVGWMVDVVYTGHDPAMRGGPDYRWWRDNGIEVICRLDDGEGTIPLPQFHDAFAQRCANVVEDSQGVEWFVVGNEWGNAVERPYGRVITTADYISCYRKAWAAVKTVRPNAKLAPAAIGSWNTETGDWLQMYRDVLEAVEADWICWHIYSHGYDPDLVTSEDTMATPYETRRYHFRCYKDFEIWTPDEKRDLPVLVTEANGNGPWQATGWIPAAFEEIQTSAMDVLCMCLFRAAQTGDGWAFTEAAWNELEETIGEEDMAGWAEAYANYCEDGFHAQGTDHLMVADGLAIHYLHQGEGNYPRPELKPKDRNAGQSEVWEGRYSQSGFYISAVGRFGLVSDPVPVQAGLRTRASAMYMHVYAAQFGLGCKCGIIDGDGPFTGGPVWPVGGEDPFNSEAIVWGGWRWARQDDVNLPQREWAKLQTPEIHPSGGWVRMVVQFNVDVAGAGSHGHWDAFLVEQYVEGAPEPPPNGLTEEDVRRIVREELSLARWVLE